MEFFDDTHAIFTQLGAIPAAGAVKTLIENHDAWTHNSDIETALNAALRARLANLPADGVRDSRIHTQRQTLFRLVTPLKSRLATAG